VFIKIFKINQPLGVYFHNPERVGVIHKRIGKNYNGSGIIYGVHLMEVNSGSPVAVFVGLFIIFIGPFHHIHIIGIDRILEHKGPGFPEFAIQCGPDEIPGSIHVVFRFAGRLFIVALAGTA